MPIKIRTCKDCLHYSNSSRYFGYCNYFSRYLYFDEGLICGQYTKQASITAETDYLSVLDRIKTIDLISTINTVNRIANIEAVNFQNDRHRGVVVPVGSKIFINQPNNSGSYISTDDSAGILQSFYVPSHVSDIHKIEFYGYTDPAGSTIDIYLYEGTIENEEAVLHPTEDNHIEVEDLEKFLKLLIQKSITGQGTESWHEVVLNLPVKSEQYYTIRFVCLTGTLYLFYDQTLTDFQGAFIPYLAGY